MAYPSLKLIDALRATANKLGREDAEYRWTHMGACNCGHLAQHVTRLSASELRRISQSKAGEWADQALEHCATSGIPMDDVIGELLGLGLEPVDIGHLERLSDKRVLRRLPPEARDMDFRERADVVLYMRTWTALLEEELAALSSGLPKVA